MEYVIVFVLVFNTGLFYYTALQIVDYLNWKRNWREQNEPR